MVNLKPNDVLEKNLMYGTYAMIFFLFVSLVLFIGAIGNMMLLPIGMITLMLAIIYSIERAADLIRLDARLRK